MDWFSLDSDNTVLTELAQDSDEWHKWRSQGLGSSDAPVVMQVSPWKSLRELWLEKTGQGEAFKGNWATERGKRLEGPAREKYEMIARASFKPETLVHPEHSFMRASFDGINHEIKLVLEIKCPGQKDHLTARDGKVPEKYYPQLQHLLFVSGYDDLVYVSYDELTLYTVLVKADNEYQQQLLQKCTEFWHMVTNKIDPDAEHAIDDQIVESWVHEYAELLKQQKSLEERLDEVKAKLKERIKEKAIVSGYRLEWSDRKGPIDYSQIEAIKNIDLEKYRKPNVKVFSVKPI